jgi:hypothetical protein
MVGVMVFIAVATFVIMTLVNDNRWAIREGLNDAKGDLSTVGQTKPECDASHVGAVFGNEVCQVSGSSVKCVDRDCTSQERTTNYAWRTKSG